MGTVRRSTTERACCCGDVLPRLDLGTEATHAIAWEQRDGCGLTVSAERAASGRAYAL